eukprot:1946728-Karenia_brevis.AAC.1
MATSNSHLTKLQQDKVARGIFVTPNRKFLGKGSFKWGHHVLRLAEDMHTYHGNDVVCWPQNYDNLAATTTTTNYFACPHGHYRLATQPLFS